jgi:oligoribonuclease
MTEKRTVLTWVDLETTGLRPPSDHRILEFAVVFTDLELDELASVQGVIPQSVETIRDLADDYVIDMHTSNGLLAEIEAASSTDYVGELGLAEAKILGAMTAIGGDNTIFVIGGSTVGFDKSYLEVHMPALFDALHYRQLDVSTYKVGFPEIFGTETNAAHRAMADIRQSIEQQAKMRRAMRAQECLQAILDYEPVEVVKDEFAYDRMVEAYRDAARAGLGLAVDVSLD